MAFEEQIATEEACRLYLEQLRWPKRFLCPRCASTEARRMGREGMATAGSVGGQTSVTFGTILSVAGFLRDSGFACCGLSPTRRTVAAPWRSNTSWGLADTKQRGLGCTNFVGPWCVRVVAPWPRWWKSMKPMWVAKNQVRGPRCVGEGLDIVGDPASTRRQNRTNTCETCPRCFWALVDSGP